MKYTEKMFEISEAGTEYYICYMKDNLYYYLHSDLVIRGIALHEGKRSGWYSSRKTAEETITKFLKKENRQVEEKGIVVEYEKVYTLGGDKGMKVLKVNALMYPELPNAYFHMEKGKELVYMANNCLFNGEGMIALKEEYIYLDTDFKKRLAYIAKAGHNLALVKQELREKKEQEEKTRKSEKKQAQWSGVKKVRF